MSKKRDDTKRIDGVRKFVAGDLTLKGEPHPCAPKRGHTWCADGKRKDRSHFHEHYTTRAAALTYARGEMEGTRPDKPAAITNETFEEYAERWMVSKRSQDPDSIRAALKRAYRFIGSTPLQAIDGLALEGIQTQLLNEKKFDRDGEPVLDDRGRHKNRFAPGTVQLTMTYVNAVMRKAISENKATITTDALPGKPNLTPSEEKERTAKVTPEQVPTDDEAIRIMAAAPPRFRLAVMLGFLVGMRIGEILGLRPVDIDLVAGTIRIEEQQQRRGRVEVKSARSFRTIEVDDAVRFELRRAVRDDPQSNRSIFIGPRGGVPRRDAFYKAAWKPALEAAGLDRDRYKFHSSRHYCVSVLLAEGTPRSAVADFVGDSVETITKTYEHWIRESDDKPKDAMARRIARATARSTASESPSGTVGE